MKRLPLIMLALVLLSGCEDERIVRQERMDDCINHYRAESYKVASRTCLVAAEMGIVDAQWLLGNIYFYDLANSGKTAAEALEWLKKAAESLTEAQLLVAGIYLDGNQVEQDFQMAYRYYSRAAENDDPEAQFNLGMMFYLGQGRTQDFSAAISWFKRSAMQEHTMSINNLAWLYATSTNQSYRNPEKARFWSDKIPEEVADNSTFLDTKAAVLAVAGEFEKAVEFQNLAIRALPDDISEEELLGFQQRLESYQNKTPWTE